MQTVRYRLVEFFVIFVLTPMGFTLSFPAWIKLFIGSVGFAYVVFVLLRKENNKLKITKHLNWKLFWKQAVFKLFIITLFTTVYMYVFDKQNLYIVVRTKPLLWVMILFIYSLFSVYPQELLFRTFFFQRYESLFRNNTIFILVNAAIFSLAHLFFKNTLVMFLTFIGGILFALTFKRTKSTLLVSVEHAIYGSWLFTVGMGNMLGFPS